MENKLARDSKSIVDMGPTVKAVALDHVGMNNPTGASAGRFRA